MPTYFQRPENALKRAEEFIEVGKKQRALDALYDVIKSKKHRTWQKIHDSIMRRYLELCVELKKNHIAKEGLYQYKNICQQVNIKSLEDVIRAYITLAEEKTEQARQESHQSVIDIDDLDVVQCPESLLLSAVSGEDTQDRTDRAILTPWVKFLWESYRQCLELLRNNKWVERLYQDLAKQAFKFCLKYSRKTEFRKLCDNLRTHLSHISKHQGQQSAINLQNPDSQAMHLETRLVQLDSAIQMELWQEAFKAVEDIHGLVVLSKKPPKPQLMANYYQKLGLVFWKSGNQLFHACAWHRLFHLYKDQKKSISEDELQKMASRVLCATLSIPISQNRDKLDILIDQEVSYLDKQRRLATLLMLNSPPTRTGLIKDLNKFNMLQHLPPELTDLYNCIEYDFNPLKLATRTKSSLKYIEDNEDLSQYTFALQEITIMRILKQVSQVYENIQFSRLSQLCPFADSFRLERAVVEAARSLDLQVRIDHRTRTLFFGTDLGVSQKEDAREGPQLQAMPTEQLRMQLVQMADALLTAQRLIQPDSIKNQHEELRQHIVHNYKQVAKRNHHAILQRQKIIEDRKEELENLSNQRDMMEMQKMEEERVKKENAEKQRLKREMEDRAQQRLNEEKREIQRKIAKERLEALRKSEIGARAFADIAEEDLAELDTEEIMAKQVQQIEKEKKELNEKLRSQEKKVDFFARAKRVEEIPLIEKLFAEESVKMKDFWIQQENERISALKLERESALEHKERMMRMREDRTKFVNQMKDRRKSAYKEKLKDFEKKLAEEKEKRLEERRERRKEDRRIKRQKEREEEAQRARDEQLLREREEQERIEREAAEEREREFEERQRKLDEIEQKKRAKEKELEEKLARDKEDRDKKETGSTPWRPRFREMPKDKEKDDTPISRPPPRSSDSRWGDRDRDRDRDIDRDRDRDEGGSRWRRDDRDSGRDRDFGGRDIRRDEEPRDRRDFSRDDDRDRDFGRRDEPSRFSDRFASRDIRTERDFGSRRDDDRDRDRGFGRRDDDRGPRDFGRRDDDRGPRDFGRRDDDRGPRDFGRRDDDRGPRDFGRRDDDRGPRDFGRRDEDRDRSSRFASRDIRRDEPNFGSRDIRRDENGPSEWRRGGGGGRDSDRDRRDAWRDGRDGGRDSRDRDDGGRWRRGGDPLPPPRDDRRDMRDSPSRPDAWRRKDASPPRRRSPDRSRDERPREDDGWTTVRH